MFHKHTVILESCRDNNGERSVWRMVLEPYATELPHFHTLFKESFYVEAGTLDLWNGFGKVHLELAQAMSIEPNTPHHYVAGKTGATVTVTLEPGNAVFEAAIRILQGLERDAAYSTFGISEADQLLLRAVIAELSDAHFTEEAKEQMDTLLHSSQAEKVKALKEALLAQYDFKI
jgi:quercetin dioxygenase-like cupin family protein